MPKVSVITPVYNGEKYLQSSIESLLQQSFSDWELILVDDGSRDSTPHIIAGFTDSRIIKIRQENAGEAAARNTGLEHATGEYIAFLDADDLYLPDALTERVAYLDSHPQVDILISDGYFCNESGEKLYRLSEIRSAPPSGNELERLILDPTVVTVPICTLTRRRVIESVQARFDRSLVIGPDWDFWIQLSVQANFAYLDSPNCLYRVHQSNITRTSGVNRRLEDLIRGRLKVLQAPWFGKLSLATRRQFFYHLLTELLSGQPTRQLELLNHPVLQALPTSEQASLWRQVGIDCLLTGAVISTVLQCLQHAQVLDSNDRKTRILLQSLRLGRSIPLLLLKSWGAWTGIKHFIHSIGKPKPRAVPPQLKPVGK